MKTVLFADENTCNVFGSDGHNDVWRKSREELLDRKNLCPIYSMVVVVGWYEDAWQHQKWEVSMLSNQQI